MMTYAGIGSRRAPEDILGLCRRIAAELHERGMVLRSGHAIGCDQAFEDGADTLAQVFLPWKDFEDHVPIRGRRYIMPTVAALQMAADHHPAPEHLSMASLRLHARNCHILLGPALDDPVARVVCWAPDEKRGGTAFGIRLALAKGIAVDNLADPLTRGSYEVMC